MKIQRTQNLFSKIPKLNYQIHNFASFGLGLWTSKSSFHFDDVGSTSIGKTNEDGREEAKSNGSSMCSSKSTSWKVGVN
jgi:hypothetical protein